MAEYKGRIARIDLSSGKIHTETIDEETTMKFLGGRGLAAKMMLESVKAGIDPLSPDNILVFATGPFAGTGVQGNDRMCISAKSPLTGLFFHCSMGGRFASTLKQAGYDALVLMGKADKPKYLLVDKGNIEIRNAERLLGRAPKEVLSILSNEMEDFEVCTTGTAGENSVRYASIIHPRHSGRDGVAGRGGLGAVMASKNLKAIVVKRGEGSGPSVFSSTLLKEVRKTIQGNLNTASKHLTLLGTPFGIGVVNDLGALGTKNIAEESFEFAQNISGERLKDQYYRKNIGCHSCPVLCGKLCELDNELYKNPEYETLYALGSMVGVDDLEKIIEANNLCDAYGLDTISMGVSIAFAMECFEKGMLSHEQVGGHKLRFGDGDLVLTLIQETADRRGLGRLLAEGTRMMSQVLGGESWKYAYQSKGLELAGHSARALKALSLGYATGTRGGSHQDTRGRYGPGMDDYKDKVEQAIATQNFCAVGDSLIQCRFVMEAGCGIEFNEIYTDLIKATLGWSPDAVELNEIGQRICNTERMFNVREGVSREDDILPYRVMYEEIPEGPLKGQRTPPDKLEEMLDDYYERRGWDENGIPRH